MVSQKRSVKEERRLILLADGGALADLNERMESESTPKKDFVKIPDAVEKKLGEEFPIDNPIESRIFCTVGSEKAQNFLKSISQEWTVKPFALSMVRYERDASSTDGNRHPFRLRFHAYLGYVLGLLAGSRAKTSEQLRRPIIVGVLTNDPHLIPCMSDLKAGNAEVDVRLVWWENALSEEVSYLAARNGVTVCLLPNEDDGVYRHPHHRDKVLEGLLSI
jgi:hypothetical protein